MSIVRNNCNASIYYFHATRFLTDGIRGGAVVESSFEKQALTVY